MAATVPVIVIATEWVDRYRPPTVTVTVLKILMAAATSCAWRHVARIRASLPRGVCSASECQAALTVCSETLRQRHRKELAGPGCTRGRGGNTKKQRKEKSTDECMSTG